MRKNCRIPATEIRISPQKSVIVTSHRSGALQATSGAPRGFPSIEIIPTGIVAHDCRRPNSSRDGSPPGARVPPRTDKTAAIHFGTAPIRGPCHEHRQLEIDAPIFSSIKAPNSVSSQATWGRLEARFFRACFKRWIRKTGTNEGRTCLAERQWCGPSVAD